MISLTIDKFRKHGYGLSDNCDQFESQDPVKRCYFIASSSIVYSMFNKMVVGCSQQETLELRFVLLGTRHEGDCEAERHGIKSVR
ncbi:unnamed protein product [Schistosoma mattheei]|uniref:Uncharacterized protein n=1 Tax=Schistosoma mattheei TaxID=31246 RepID=A0A183PRM3_9TREM|nr:unnamed protein product [Schistosoma mattheei]